jgi:hypothetical protein
MKKSRVVDSGSSFGKVSTAGLTPTVVVGSRQTPHDMWSNVKKGDIGAGYSPIETASIDEARRRQDKADPVWKNRFVYGTSSFVYFVVVARTVKLPPKKTGKKPINYANKLDKKTRVRFAEALNRNVNATASFLVKELLPISLSLMSSMTKTEELAMQLTDSKVELPVTYMRGKMTMAMYLRVIRFVSETFDLNEEERRLMALEYTRPWSQS